MSTSTGAVKGLDVKAGQYQRIGKRAERMGIPGAITFKVDGDGGVMAWKEIKEIMELVKQVTGME